MPDNVFVYVVCGSRKHIDTLHRSIKWLEWNANSDIMVVTDIYRNEIPVKHRHVIHVETPAHFNHHQASIYLKTSLHRHVPQNYEKYCYLDSDVLAINNGADQVFSLFTPPVTFAPDLPVAENNVSRFSPWAVNCPCTGLHDTASCGHLVAAIQQKFGLQVASDWVHWNGGVFVFNPHHSADFMERWHQNTMQILEEPYWQTRDQGTLIVTVWQNGLQNHPVLPQKFNFIADLNNAFLCFLPDEGYALHPDLPKINPVFLHLFHSNLENPDWSLKADVEEPLMSRNRIWTTVNKTDAKEEHWFTQHFRQHGIVNGMLPLFKRIAAQLAFMWQHNKA